MSADGVQIELREHDRRISGLHRTTGALATQVGNHETAISNQRIELDETRKDVETITETLKEDREERRKEGADTRKALYTVAAFMATFSASIIGLVIALLSHA